MDDVFSRFVAPGRLSPGRPWAGGLRESTSMVVFPTRRCRDDLSRFARLEIFTVQCWDHQEDPIKINTLLFGTSSLSYSLSVLRVTLPFNADIFILVANGEVDAFVSSPDPTFAELVFLNNDLAEFPVNWCIRSDVYEVHTALDNMTVFKPKPVHLTSCNYPESHILHSPPPSPSHLYHKTEALEDNFH